MGFYSKKDAITNRRNINKGINYASNNSRSWNGQAPW